MMRKRNIHLLGVPHTVTNRHYVACAYTQKIVKFAKMFKDHPDYNLIHYGHEDSVLDAELVSVTSNDDLQKAYGDYDWKKGFFKFNQRDHAYQTFYKNTVRELSKRFVSNDIILPFFGAGVRPVCDAIEAMHKSVIIIEPGIGYGEGSWCDYRIFESYATMHATQGTAAVTQCNPKWYDVVIPNYFDPDDFTYNSEKEDYFLFIGRVYDGKGVNIAAEACVNAKVKLKVYGQKDPNFELMQHPLIEYGGFANTKKRQLLMAGARGALLPSQYMEPFGGVQVENLLSGTPTITTDWGAFAENNIQGVTGYRCRNLGDFTEAILRVNQGNISSSVCHQYGSKYTLDAIRPLYEKYFRDVINVHEGMGWYEVDPTKRNLLTK